MRRLILVLCMAGWVLWGVPAQAATFADLQANLERSSAELQAKQDTVSRQEQELASYEQQLQELQAKADETRVGLETLRAQVAALDTEVSVMREELGAMVRAVAEELEASKVVEAEVELKCGSMTLNDCQNLAVEHARRSAKEEASNEWLKLLSKAEDMGSVRENMLDHLTVDEVKHEVGNVNLSVNNEVTYKIVFVFKGEVDDAWLESFTGQSRQSHQSQGSAANMSDGPALTSREAVETLKKDLN